jgi:hypothetical protein
LESLIDLLQHTKEIYAGGQALDRDQRFRYLYKKFVLDLKDLDVTRVQSESEQRLNMMITQKAASVLVGGGLASSIRGKRDTKLNRSKDIEEEVKQQIEMPPGEDQLFEDTLSKPVRTSQDSQRLLADQKKQYKKLRFTPKGMVKGEITI